MWNRRRGCDAGRLAALTGLLFLLACSGRMGGGTLLGVGTGTATGQSPASGMVGTWRRLLVVRTQTDVITSETTWVFSIGGSCERAVVSNSVSQGVPVTERSGCTYQVVGGRVTVQFGTGAPAQFTVVTSGNRLFLGGVEFTRVG